MAISHIQMGSGDPIAITLPGLNASVTELNYSAGVTSSIQQQLNTKMSDYSIELYNGTQGNPKPVRFASFNYSTCNSENGLAVLIKMVSGHGNGSSYAFLQDAIIKVTHTGGVSVDNFKYYGAETDTYDGQKRQYGDIFWMVDETNKIVDFYCLMGQFARVYQTPWKRLTYSTGGTVTQYTGATIYSSGTKIWANNSNIALESKFVNYYTKTEANEQINNSVNTTKQWVEGKGYLTSNSLSGYATEQWVTNKGYLTPSSLTDYATKKYADDGVNAAKGYTDTKISNLIGVGTPDTLDTLRELSQALKDNPNTVTVLENAIATKADAATTLSGYGITDAYTKTETNNIMSGYLPLTGGTMSGTIDFSDRATWVKPYLLAFKDAEPTNSATYPYTGFYQWGNEWQVNARDASNTFKHNVFSINLDSKVARFEAVPNVAGVNVALTNQIPTTLKNPYSLTIQGNGATLDTYDGSSAKTINLLAEHFNAYTKSETYSKTEVGNLLDDYLPLAGGTLGGTLNVSNGGKINQGTTSGDTTVASMNRFQSDLYIQGDGSAPNNPRVAGFYLGKSTTDDNRHMDIVSGGEYSYIDFNQANAEVDYNVRLIANVQSGYTEFQWGGAGTDRILNVAGTLMQAGQPVATQAQVDEQYYALDVLTQQIARAVQQKADKATTLSGYGITDAYTKTQVDSALSGKANNSHGNHVPTTESANNARFLRNDNSWQTVTPSNIGAYSKSEVDTSLAGKVSKSGDTMSGALTVNSNITASGTVKVGNAVTLQYNSSNACLDFIF